MTHINYDNAMQGSGRGVELKLQLDQILTAAFDEGCGHILLSDCTSNNVESITTRDQIPGFIEDIMRSEAFNKFARVYFGDGENPNTVTYTAPRIRVEGMEVVSWTKVDWLRSKCI